jgi:hypothetical protein
MISVENCRPCCLLHRRAAPNRSRRPRHGGTGRQGRQLPSRSTIASPMSPELTRKLRCPLSARRTAAGTFPSFGLKRTLSELAAPASTRGQRQQNLCRSHRNGRTALRPGLPRSIVDLSRTAVPLLKSALFALLPSGVSREWGDHAAFANCGPGLETGSKRWPNPEPSALL